MKTTEVEDDLPANGNVEDVHANCDRSGVQSIEIGPQLLVAFTRAMRAVVLGDLACATGMHPSKAHRYLVSLQRVDTVSQNPLTGHYGLSPSALRLGLASLNRSDAVVHTRPLLAGLRGQTGYTVGIVMWNDRGPTVVHWKKVDGAPGMNLRIGNALPMLNSAIGRLFGAYQPMKQTLPLMERELHERAGGDLPSLPQSLTDYYHLCKSVRTEGASWVSGSLLPDVNTLSLPVFDAHGQLVLMLIALSLQPLFHAQRDDELEHTLRTFVMRLSAMLQAPAERPAKADSRRSRTMCQGYRQFHPVIRNLPSHNAWHPLARPTSGANSTITGARGFIDLSTAAILVQGGVTSGAIYALPALVLALVFSVTRVTFIPQGESVAYGTLTLAAIQANKAPLSASMLVALSVLAFLVEVGRTLLQPELRLHMLRAGAVYAGEYLVFPIAVYVATRMPGPMTLPVLT